MIILCEKRCDGRKKKQLSQLLAEYCRLRRQEVDEWRDADEFGICQNDGPIAIISRPINMLLILVNN